jgi:hypothetical protein
MSFRRPLAAVAVGAAALAAPAHAAINPVCAGTAATVVVCVTYNTGALPSVNPTGSSYNDCIYLGTPPCTPVSVPIPTVTPGSGTPVVVSCGGRIGQNLCAAST